MKDRKLHLTILLALILLTVGFIWINSALPGQDSKELSGNVGEIFEKALSFLRCPQNIMDFLLANVRKVAHVIEYAVIGFELGFLWSGLRKGAQGLWNAWSTVMAIALFDETIQLMSAGRGPQITDVLLDTASGTIAILLVYFCMFIINSIRKLNKNR